MHDLCGISLRVQFIPPSQSGTPGQLQAFLVGSGAGTPTDGDQPAVGTVAPARPGVVATVLGRRFEVIAVNTATRQVDVRALC